MQGAKVWILIIPHDFHAPIIRDWGFFMYPALTHQFRYTLAKVLAGCAENGFKAITMQSAMLNNGLGQRKWGCLNWFTEGWRFSADITDAHCNIG
jgi:hypothetical protein